MRTVSEVQLRETHEEFPFRAFVDSSNAALTNHWHKEMEIIYLKSGKMQLFINGLKYAFCSGDIMIIASGDVHGAVGSMDNCRIVVQFDENLIGSAYLSLVDMEQIHHTFRSIHRLSCKWEESTKIKVLHIVQQLLEMQRLYNENPNSIIKLRIQSLLYDFICTCVCEIPIDEEQSKRSENMKNKEILANLKIILHYINNEYRENITLTDAADVLNFTPNYFLKYFKKYTGSSFHAFLNQYRISKAISHMMEGRYHIKEISEMVGIKNVKTFNRLFKNHTGLSPSAYKKEYF